MKDGVLDASMLLVTIVFEQSEGIFTKKHQSDQIAQGDRSHKQVTEVPHKVETGHCSQKNEGTAR